MTCPNCGHRVRDGAKFCDECGVVLPESTGAAAVPEPVAPAAPPRRIAPATRPQGSFTVNPIPAEGEPPPAPPVDTTGARRMFAVVAVGLIALLCLCCAVAAGTLYLLTQNQGSMPFPS